MQQTCQVDLRIVPNVGSVVTANASAIRPKIPSYRIRSATASRLEIVLFFKTIQIDCQIEDPFDAVLVFDCPYDVHPVSPTAPAAMRRGTIVSATSSSADRISTSPGVPVRGTARPRAGSTPSPPR